MNKEFFSELREFLLINPNCTTEEMEEILELVSKLEVEE